MPVSISIVIPVYSGEKYLSELVRQIAALKDRLDPDYLSICEVILVDDGAIDDSPSLIDRLAEQKEWVTALHLSRNFGQHPATIAGIVHSSGDWVVTLDEDLQHPPSEIPILLKEAITTGSDVIYARPNERVHGSHARDTASRLYKRFVSWASGNPNAPLFNSFRLVRGPIARAAAAICSPETYFDMALSWYTLRVGVVRMPLRDERYQTTGGSGYNFRSLLSHARRMIMSSRIKLMRAPAALGAVIVVLSFAIGILLVALKFTAPQFTPPGWTSMVALILFFGGLLSFMVGVAIEYLSVLVMGVHGKPVFFIADREADVVLLEYFKNDRIL